MFPNVIPIDVARLDESRAGAFKRVAGSAALILTLAIVLGSDRAHAGELVESDSTGNRLYVLLWHGNPTDSLDGIAVSVNMPGFTSPTTELFVPPSVPADSGLLAGFSFNVNPAITGTSGDAVITVTATIAGDPTSANLTIPIVVVDDAPSIVNVDAILGNEGPDSDGDGVADSVETHYGSNPADPNSMPGSPKIVPTLTAPGLMVLALLLMALAMFATMRVRREKATVYGGRG